MESSWGWATTGQGDGLARGYSQDQVLETNRMLHCGNPSTEGVALGYLNELVVTNPEGDTLRVASGGGMCYGIPYRNTGNVDLLLRRPLLGTTGFRVSLRADWREQTVRLLLRQNDDGGSGIPGLEQTAGHIWDIPIASGSVTIGGFLVINDDRVYLGSSAQINYTMMADRIREFLVQAVECEIAVVHQVRVLTTGWPLDPDLVTNVYGNFEIPLDFASSMTVSALLAATVAGGNMMATQWVRYAQIGETVFTHQEGYGPLAFPMPAANIIQAGAVVLFSWPTAGDIVMLQFQRDGADAADTAPVAIFLGWHVAYLADS